MKNISRYVPDYADSFIIFWHIGRDESSKPEKPWKQRGEMIVTRGSIRYDLDGRCGEQNFIKNFDRMPSIPRSEPYRAPKSYPSRLPERSSPPLLPRPRPSRLPQSFNKYICISHSRNKIPPTQKYYSHTQPTGGFLDYVGNDHRIDIRRPDEHTGRFQHRSNQTDQRLGLRRLGAAQRLCDLRGVLAVHGQGGDRPPVPDPAEIPSAGRRHGGLHHLHGHKEHGRAGASAGGHPDRRRPDHHRLSHRGVRTVRRGAGGLRVEKGYRGSRGRGGHRDFWLKMLVFVNFFR